MSSITLSPALGWPIGGALAVLMVVMAVLVVVLHIRRRGRSDDTIGACVRRCIVCVVVALMALTPCIVSTTTSRAVNATDVVIAVDVTGSMAVEDAHYGSDETISRLEAAQQAVHDLTDMYQDASFAAIHFGASSSLDVPLTPDELAIGTWVDTLSVETTSVSSGSSLDEPLDVLLTTVESIREQHPDDAIVLYIITDGEETSNATRRTFSSLRGYVDDAFTIGVGSTEGGKIPVISSGTDDSDDSDSSDDSDDSDDDGEWVTDPDTGEDGISALDEETLSDIADEMGGSYLALDEESTIDEGESQRASDEWKVEETEQERTRLTAVVWPLAIVAVVLLAVELGCWLSTSRRLL